MDYLGGTEMGKTEKYSEMIARLENVEPIAYVNGVPFYDWRGAVDLAKYALLEVERGYVPPDLGQREMNPDGMTYKRTRRTAIVAPEQMWENRVRRVERIVGEADEAKKEVELEVVRDYAEIMLMHRGAINKTHVTAYIVKKEGRGAGRKMKVVGTRQIPASEFINEFTARLSREDFIPICELIEKHGIVPEPINMEW